MNPNERQGDLVLTQGTYVFIQDGASGAVDVIVGPHKASLADTDKPVTFDHKTRKFERTSLALDAVRTFPTANEGQYIILHNPARRNGNDDKDGKEEKKYPNKGKNTTNDFQLNVGHQVNIPGPISFALFPGQHAETIDGHQLKSNEYLIVRVYNEDLAKKNLKNAIIKTAEGTKKEEIKDADIIIGKLFVIKGTDISFYIPPTGFEVVKDQTTGAYVRNAVTLERLEYCILLGQDGEKRYVKGPDVVFPKPTENFIMHNDAKKFRAVELNDNMGLYIKVIADYEEHDKKKHVAGDELFVTGKEMKIYYPRAEHSIIKYGDMVVHYAVAIPEGEGRYVLNKNTGAVDMVTGPKMYLPDPRKEVLVKRILDEKTIELYYPGNAEALEYNRSLIDVLETTPEADRIQGGMSNAIYSRSSFTNDKAAAAAHEALATMDFMQQDNIASYAGTGSFGPVGVAGFSGHRGFSGNLSKTKDMKRNTTFSKPRTITLDTKYEGVVSVNIWPGFAVQLIKKNGTREVVEGPKTVNLQYDETLETLHLSTGKPKTDTALQSTVYLQTKNNIVSDIVTVETKDSVGVTIRLSYRVNFDETQSKKWFNVPNYVKLLTQHLRSVLKNAIKKHNIEDFNVNATDIIRDVILGKSGEDKESKARKGKQFDENGMNVYDVEVLNIEIGDSKIANLLKASQFDTVEKNLNILKGQKNLEYVKKTEEFAREELKEKAATETLKLQNQLAKIVEDAKNELAKLKGEEERQELLGKINDESIGRERKNKEMALKFLAEEADIEIKKVKEKMGSITPGLIEAITSLGTVSLSEILAKNIKAQTSGLHGIFPAGGLEGILETLKDTDFGNKLKEMTKKVAIPTNGAHN